MVGSQSLVWPYSNVSSVGGGFWRLTELGQATCVCG